MCTRHLTHTQLPPQFIVQSQCGHPLQCTLVAPVLAYGCEVWGVYALASIGTQACEWGTDRALLGESVQKAFVRGTLQVPLSTTVVLMKSEVGTKPLVHA
jgi:hypothetical protein